MSDDLGQRLSGIEDLLREFEEHGDPASQAEAREIVRGVLDLHRAGLERVIELLRARGEVGRAIVEEIARDGLVGSMLLLHDLHPHDLQMRVDGALRKIAGAELISIEDGVVRVKIAKESLRTQVDDALAAAASDAMSVEVVAVPEGFVPLEKVGHMRSATVRS